MNARLLVVVALLSPGCVHVTLEQQTRRYLEPPRNNVCPDGAPLRVIQDPRCAHGLCGFTCAPDRWAAPF